MHAVAYTACHPADHAEAFLDLDLPAPAAPEGRAGGGAPAAPGAPLGASPTESGLRALTRI